MLLFDRPFSSEKFNFKSTKFSNKDYITYYNKTIVVYPEKGNTDIFYLDVVSAVKEKVSLKKYVNSFANDVGILNIARRLALQGENIWDGRFAAKESTFTDLTKIPSNPEDLKKLMSLKNKLWASLDPELKGNMTFDEFCESFDQSKFNDFIKSKTQTKTEKVEEVTTDEK